MLKNKKKYFKGPVKIVFAIAIIMAVVIAIIAFSRPFETYATLQKAVQDRGHWDWDPTQKNADGLISVKWKEHQ